MLSGEKRGLSARRGMTVLGKIPAVPKPINLPSQRLENRGLDPNVELVPRGTVSWGSSGRSPPTSGSPWGNTALSSSPPVSTGAWGGAAAKVATSSGSNTSVGGWPGNPSRPSSAGSGPRPSSTGSGGQSREQSVNANAWGLPVSRPSSASGVLGQALSQPTIARPRSAETRPGSSQSSTLSRFADSTNEPVTAPVQAWGASGISAKSQGEQPQASRFTLTPVDFPMLGSEKNSDLRPQQTSTSSGRPLSADGTRFSEKEQRLPPPQGPYDDLPNASLGPYGGQARGVPDTWCRENPPLTGPLPHNGHWDGDVSHLRSYVSAPAPPDAWHREDSGHRAISVVHVTDDTWPRGASPVCPYGTGRLSHDPFLHQRFDSGVMPYRRGGPGQGGYGRQGDVYGHFVRQTGLVHGRPGRPLGPGLHLGSMQYEGYYGPSGAAPYGSMDEKEMIMLGMVGPGPGMYGNFPHHSGPPHEHFNWDGHSDQGTGPRIPPMHSERSHGYEGGAYAQTIHKELEKPKDARRAKEGGNFKDGACSASMHDSGKEVSEGPDSTISFATDLQKHRHHEWGAAVSNGDEPMDFSKPAFEEDISSAPPSSAGLDMSGVLLEEGKTATNKVSHRHASSGIHLLKKQDKCVEESTRSRAKFNIQLSSPGMSCKTLYMNDEESNFQKQEAQGEGEDIKKCCVVKEVLIVSRSKVTEGVSSQNAGRESSSQKTLVDICEGREVTTSSAKDPVCEKKEDGFGTLVATPFMPNVLQQIAGKAATLSYFPSSAGSSSGIETSASNILTGSNSSVETCISNTETVLPVLPAVVKTTIVLQPGRKLNDHNSETEGLKGQDKLDPLKRNGEVNSDNFHAGGGAVEHVAHIDIIKDSTLIQEPSSRDEHKPKLRFNIHEGEKEWRPKASTSHPRTETAKYTGIHARKARSTVPMVMTTSEVKSSTEKGTVKSNFEKGPLELETMQELENLQQSDSYDYEAQRARLKEIAAQRSRQLQKEEEDRIKEQRAKALAKLEELNQRTTVSFNTGEATLSQETINDNTKGEFVLEGKTVPLSASQHEAVSGDFLTGLSGVVEDSGGSENREHEKHGWDRKHPYARKEELRSRGGSVEYKQVSKSKIDGSYDATRTGPPLLPSPISQPPGSQGLLSPPVVAPLSFEPKQEPLDHTAAARTQLHTLPSQHQVPQRNKQYIQQPKRQSHVLDNELPTSVKVVSNVEPRSECFDGGLRGAIETQLILTEEVGNTAPSSDTSEGSAALRRRKNNHSGRNKNKLDRPVNVVESEQATVRSDSSAGDTSRDLKVQAKDAAGKAPSDEAAVVVNVKASSPIFKFDFSAPDISQEIAFGSVQEAIDIDMRMPKPNDDMPTKRVQRKPQLVRRPFKERGSHDPRMIEKLAANEGMVWAPIKSLSSRGVAGSEATANKADGTGETFQEIRNRNDEGSCQNSLRSKRADLERYTPKPAAKSQVQPIQVQLQSTASARQPSNQPHVSSFQGELETHAQDVSLCQSNTALVLIETKHTNDNWSNETAKVGGFHSSWRRRNPSENSGAKEVSGTVENQLLQPSIVEGAPKQKHLDAPNALPGSEQRPRDSRMHARPASTQQLRQHNQLHQAETDQQHVHEHPSQDCRMESQMLQEKTYSNQAARSLRPQLVKQSLQHKDEQQKSSSDNATFQHSEMGKQDLTVASYGGERRNFQDKVESHRRPRSAGSHVLRSPGFVNGKDPSSFGFVAQSLHKPSLTGAFKTLRPVSSSEQEQRGQEHQPSSRHQGQSPGLKDQCLINSSMKEQDSSPRKQQGKSHTLPSDSADASQSMIVVQQHQRNGQVNRQQGFSAFEREHQKGGGNAAHPSHRKQGYGHLQWQQTAPGQTERSISIEEGTSANMAEVSLINKQKQQTSSLSKQRESVQTGLHLSSRNESSKVRPLSGEVQKHSQSHYQVVYQSGQDSKQQEHQSFTLPATSLRSDARLGYSPETNTLRTGDRGAGFHFRARDHGPSRRGRSNWRFQGGKGPDMTEQSSYQNKVVVDATVDPVPSQVLG